MLLLVAFSFFSLTWFLHFDLIKVTSFSHNVNQFQLFPPHKPSILPSSSFHFQYLTTLGFLRVLFNEIQTDHKCHHALFFLKDGASPSPLPLPPPANDPPLIEQSTLETTFNIMHAFKAFQRSKKVRQTKPNCSIAWLWPLLIWPL